MTLDLDERITSWNPAAEQLFGHTQVEACGQPIGDLLFPDEAVRADAREVMRRADEHGLAHRIARRPRKDGTLVDVELLMVPLVVDGDRTGYLVIYHDITEVQRAREAAESAARAKSAFLATMSHEIRTPMNAVIGMGGLLLDTELTAEQRRFAEVICDSGDALLSLIDDILDFSKIEAEKLELEARPLDLRECVEGAVDVVAVRASEKGLDLGCLVDDDVPGAIVGDVTRLRQALVNLLANAVKFTESGEVMLTVATVEGSDDLRRLRFSVRDTGIGIPAERMAGLFDPFTQVDTSTTRRYGGTGLGLAISRRLAELLGGTLWAQSEEGRGPPSTSRSRRRPPRSPRTGRWTSPSLRASACSWSPTTPSAARSCGARPSRGGCRWWASRSRRRRSSESGVAIRSTSRCSTCRCTRWTASRSPGRFAATATSGPCRSCCSPPSGGSPRRAGRPSSQPS